MSSALMQEPRATDWRRWLEQVEEMPCAAYVVRNDADLTLLGGNQAFYRLFGYSEEELRLKYGGRLGAVLDGEPLRRLFPAGAAPVGPVTVEQRIARGRGPGWIQTQLVRCPEAEGDVLCCTAVDITQARSTAQTLRSLEDTVHILVDRGSLDCFEYDLETRTAYLRPPVSILPRTLAGEDGVCQNFEGRLLDARLVLPEFESVLRGVFQEIQGPDGRGVCELGLNHPDRGNVWARLTLALKPGVRRAVGLLEDITQEREAARSYLNETQFFQAMLSEKDAYAQVDVTENKITRIGGMWNLYNEIIHKVTYSHLIQEFINKVVHPEDRKHYLEVMQTSNFIQSLDNGVDRLGCEFRRIVDQNKMMWMQLSVYLFRDPLTRHVLALLTIKNIDAQKKREMQLLHSSRVDQLTNVYNRLMAKNLICEYLGQVQPEELCAFVVLDVDDFKRVNDLHGHEEGDRVLMHLSDLLSRAFRRSDIIGRFGGDEFIIFLKRVEQEDQVGERMRGLYAQLREETDVDPITCSAGIALSRGSVSYDELFHQADLALYRAKGSGKNCYRIYQKEDGEAGFSAAPQEVEAEGDPVPLPEWTAPMSRPQEDRQTFDSFMGVQGEIAYLVNPDTYDLICGNQAFYDRLGMSQTQCTNLKCYEAMHRRDSPCPFCSKANWFTDKFYLWRNMNLALEQEFLIKNKLVPWAGETVLLAIAVDISNDKSIVDSLESGAIESHSILSGVQHMTEAPSLLLAMESALEAIGSFFRAQAVRLWRHGQGESGYHCPYCWRQDGRVDLAGEDNTIISRWLDSTDWAQPIVVESPEAMLAYSYEMYCYMKEHKIRNQRWIRVAEGEETLGVISIDSLSSNFQNVAFLDSFSAFIASELKKRGLMENAVYAEGHDDLTDLLSRKSFEAYLAEYQPDRMACVGVVMSNFDNLKGINSTRGFQTGNYLIKQFSDMLRAAFPDDQIFRLNGDEFLVLLPDQARSDLERGVAELERLVEECGSFSVSIGHSWDDVENDLAVLIEQATQAMKINKKRHYDSTPRTADAERRRMLTELVAAIENREFEVFLQPKVELGHGTVVGAEALIRYHHKELGYIGPAQFIEMLEKNNLIRYIDLFVFEEVCRQLETWKHQDLFLPVVSLNFSRLTLLERDILSSMESIVSRYDVSRKFIEIEITESVTGMGKSVLYQAACDLYKAGFAISLDDFGTKYTNLSILADLDFTMLKVDKSLVSELGRGDNHRLIMKNIIAMCQDLGIHVLAEGIERKDQEEILQTMDCQLGQGYLYGKPMPIEEFSRQYIRFNQHQ